jgi:hypothetical protein
MGDDIYNQLPTISFDEMFDNYFTKPPLAPKSLCIIPHDDQIWDDIEFVFEFLLDIYTTAVLDGDRLFRIQMTNTTIKREPVRHVDPYNIQMNHLAIPTPWFKSFGFEPVIEEYTPDRLKSEVRFGNLKHIYCRVILKDNRSYTHLFKNTDQIFTFVINKEYIKTDKLDDIGALLHKPKDPNIVDDIEKYYVIKMKSL